MKSCRDCRNYKPIDNKMGICSIREAAVEADDLACDDFDDIATKEEL